MVNTGNIRVKLDIKAEMQKNSYKVQNQGKMLDLIKLCLALTFADILS